MTKVFHIATKAATIRKLFKLPAKHTSYREIADSILIHTADSNQANKSSSTIICNYFDNQLNGVRGVSKAARARHRRAGVGSPAKPKRKNIYSISKELSTHAKSIGMPKRCHPERGSKSYAEFYSTREWRQLRYIALRNAEGRCQCCGGMASDGLSLHVDHIKPRSRFPELELSLDNLQILCEDCNLGKLDMDDYSWRKHWEGL